MAQTPFNHWHEPFAEQFLSDRPVRSVLVAQPGQGKTLAVINLWDKLRQQQSTRNLLVITPSVLLKQQWRYMLQHHLSSWNDTSDHIIVQNVHRLKGQIGQELNRAYQQGQMLVVIDEGHLLAHSSWLVGYFQPLKIEHEDASQLLYLATAVAEKQAEMLEDLSLGTAYIYDPVTLRRQLIKQELSRFSPSQNILQLLWQQGLSIDNLTWRQFEKLVAELLEKDGYSIELMKGTKDGGVDVVAIKKDGISGYFKTLWQAKKLAKNKVGLHFIRELADSVQELKASKGIIVTTSFLTKDALARVNRDQYTLGKVDRQELEQWINRILFHS